MKEESRSSVRRASEAILYAWKHQSWLNKFVDEAPVWTSHLPDASDVADLIASRLRLSRPEILVKSFTTIACSSSAYHAQEARSGCTQSTESVFSNISQLSLTFALTLSVVQHTYIHLFLNGFIFLMIVGNHFQNILIVDVGCAR